jgi:hypothetical protein
MIFPRSVSLLRHVSLLSCLGLFAVGVAYSQSANSTDQSGQSGQSGAPGFSSSRAGLSASRLQLTAYDALPDSPEPAGSASAEGGSGQYGNGGGYGGGEKKGVLHNWTFELGGGFNAPQSSAITYGGQFTLGAGLNFNKYLSGLIEYQFIDDKLPGYLIAETGASGGNAHIWSFTFNPVVDLTPKANNGVYITGGGGFYRKVTNFTDPEASLYCDYFYGCGTIVTPQVVGHFSSNQGGFNVGAGFYHRIGGQYGESNTKFFIEGRYLDVLTPAATGITPNGLSTTTVAADTKMIPISVGLRF